MKVNVHGHASRSGFSPTYRTWGAMIRRCSNSKHDKYKYYGGAGVVVDTRWNTFVNFLADMGERPDKQQLDRIDTSKGYCKENCRWVTASTNSRNRTNNIYVKGRLLIEWCAELGLDYKLATARYYRKLSDDKILFKGNLRYKQ